MIARLLLPYVRIRETLAEFSRVLMAGGLIYFQLHARRYYRHMAGLFLRNPKALSYYLRPLISSCWISLAGQQPSNRWFAESALELDQLDRFCSRFGFVRVWQGDGNIKPMVVYRRT